MRFVRRVSGRTFLALQVRNFRLYFIGQLISISGTWMQSFAQGFLVVWTLHASPVDLGITVALPFLPMLLLGPLGGVVVDRSDKRFVLYFTQSGAAILALSLGILVSTHHVSLTAIWTIAALLGVVNLFDNPARQSFVQEMVGKELLPNAVSLNSALINMGRIVGPAIGGALLFVGVATCFYVNAASYVALLTALAMMRAGEITRIRTVSRARGQVRQGLRYAFANREIREVLTTVTIVGLFAFNFTVTLPLLAIRVLHGTSADYALITCSMGLGGLLGGLYVAHRSRAWERPDEFEPERFLTGSPSPFIFFPFGGGTRRCVGAEFARYQLAVVLGQLILSREFNPVPSFTMRPYMRGATVAPPPRMPLQVRSRSAS